MANGFVEGACNPLITTLYPDQKIRRLSLFHAWFPGGIVIGGVVAYAIDQMQIGGREHGWQIQMATMLIPLAIYGMLFLGKKFPQTERVASNVSTGDMFKECLRPFFLLFVICMVMTAATELVTGQWMPDIMTVTTGISGIIYLILTFGLMALGRTFGGPLAHRLSPVGVLIGSSIFSGIGLLLLSRANNLTSGIVAAVVFAVGVCFFWPTMLGVVNERFPKSGALGMAIVGGAGMLSTSVFLPIVGHRYDAATAAAAGGAEKLASLKAAAGAPNAATDIKQQLGNALATGGQEALQTLLYLPIILTVIFTAIYLYDKSRGGYKEEVLIQDQQEAAA
jgi:MFS family permease